MDIYLFMWQVEIEYMLKYTWNELRKMGICSIDPQLYLRKMGVCSIDPQLYKETLSKL